MRMVSEWPDLWRRVRSAAIRDAVVLALLYVVPWLRRFRPWYWRGALASVLVGGAVGLVAAYRDRRGASPTDWLEEHTRSVSQPP